jgi:hypothetical protein
MKKKEKLEAAVSDARANWRKECASPGSTAEDRHKAFTAWKKAEIVRNKALLVWKSTNANRRKTIADRRKTIASTDLLEARTDRRGQARRP